MDSDTPRTLTVTPARVHASQNALQWDLFCLTALLVKKGHKVPIGLPVALLPEELGC